MLSFSTFHDTFISLIDKSEHVNIVHYMSDKDHISECTEFNEIHNMMHFMAIVETYKDAQIHFAKREPIPHIMTRYSPPLNKTSYKPPIA